MSTGTEQKIGRPRIIRVMYRSALNGKLVRVITKVPYANLYPMTETLTRALAVGDIAWFRIDPAKPSEITPNVRANLQRWPEALRSTTERTHVTWLN
jgi:hypothetical protein